VLISAGNTQVLCTACFEVGVPEWRIGSGQGWCTAEYDMLPGSTSRRRKRNRTDGRTQEIQRLIGRALRTVLDLEALGENSILVDCDVIQADGGTRTAAITGAFVAVSDAVAFGLQGGHITRTPIRDHVAAVSIGLVNGAPALDLDYAEDSSAEVDMNVVMTGAGGLVEVQGTGERTTFERAQLDTMLDLAMTGIRQLIEAQKQALLAETGALS
jgi:ribonuclease PH